MTFVGQDQIAGGRGLRAAKASTVVRIMGLPFRSGGLVSPRLAGSEGTSPEFG